MGAILNIPKPKFKKAEAKRATTFMGMVAALLFDQKLSLRGLGRRLQVSMPGFPLPVPGPPIERSPEVKARKKLMRQQRRGRINRRGF